MGKLQELIMVAQKKSPPPSGRGRFRAGAKKKTKKTTKTVAKKSSVTVGKSMALSPSQEPVYKHMRLRGPTAFERATGTGRAAVHRVDLKDAYTVTTTTHGIDPLPTGERHTELESRTQPLYTVLFGSDRSAWPLLDVPASMAEVGLIRHGLPVSVCDHLVDTGVLTWAELHELVLPRRTLQHRRQKDAGLTPEESEKVLRLARTWVEALDVFEDAGKAGRWLRRPTRMLGSEPPLALLDTDVGGRKALEALMRLAHGMAA